MKKITHLLFALSFLLLINIDSSAQNAPAQHVILVTIDGFRPEFYLDSTYGMPTVRQLMKNGVAAEGLNPVFPSVTYPDHTTMVTGVTPAKHGIYYNTPFEPEGATGKWLWDYKLIKVPTLWDAMHKAGRKTACVRWPVTFQAPIDYRIPEYWNYKDMSDSRPYTAAATAPAGLWEEIQKNATGVLQADDLAAEHDELVQDENVARIAGYLIRTYKPGFTALHLACTDHYEHQDGRESYMVRASVAGADRCIKTLVESVNRAGIADSTLIVILGDHGFENIYRSFNPNYLLKENGLINDVKTGDWKAQFHSSGGSSFLHLKDPNDKQTLEKVKLILENCPDSVKRYFAIIDKNKMTAIGADPNSPLALTGINGTTFGSKTNKIIETFDKVKGTHGFFPDHKQIQTGFVAFGPGLKKGAVAEKLDMIDVAPLIVKLSGIDLPGMQGRLHTELLE
ncbi:sulfatase-like hydrolase/transferase [Pedobacter sp. HMF7647]|uniref:Sulfatase-like hydrolase/transferase n=1 Tax=Hufsiella arboris TaxID=2695275 RepID=A0A7K1YA56_9SPHI|nr:ectonucleotide pyrophosphatase/phosphodiesterase [Hufsiella arboris]MXV51009.1 sulfatase-like hydrolase/transferase [Hufsiella arboris]